VQAIDPTCKDSMARKLAQVKAPTSLEELQKMLAKAEEKRREGGECR
jgi:hypothetical protein